MRSGRGYVERLFQLHKKHVIGQSLPTKLGHGEHVYLLWSENVFAYVTLNGGARLGLTFMKHRGSLEGRLIISVQWKRVWTTAKYDGTWTTTRHVSDNNARALRRLYQMQRQPETLTECAHSRRGLTVRPRMRLLPVNVTGFGINTCVLTGRLRKSLLTKRVTDFDTSLCEPIEHQRNRLPTCSALEIADAVCRRDSLSATKKTSAPRWSLARTSSIAVIVCLQPAFVGTAMRGSV